MTSWTRDGNGWVTGTDDPIGNHTTIQLDTLGFPTTITFADGKQTVRGYQTDFHAMTKYVDELGNVWTYTYDSGGHQETIKDPLSDVTTNTYHSTYGLLETVKDALGRVMTNVYDSSRRLQATVNAAGDRATYTFDSNGNVATYKDERGYVTTYTNDALGRPLSIVHADGGIETNTYDAAGELTTYRDARNTPTNYTYGKAGQQTKVVDASGYDIQASSLFSFDAAGQQTRSRNGNGVWGSQAYDVAGRLKRTIDALGAESLTVYDLAGEATGSRDPLGRLSLSNFDARYRQTKYTDALSNVVTTIYDDAGNVSETVDSLGRRTTFAYDKLNRQTSMTEAAGTADARTSGTTYDAVGNVATQTDYLGRVTSFGYDTLNRVVTMTEAVGTSVQRTMTYAYDKTGNKTGETDWRGYRSDWTYDGMSRVLTYTEAVGQSETRASHHQYDLDGNDIQFTDPLGVTVSVIYDYLNRGIKRTMASGTSVASTVTTMFDQQGQAYGTIDALGKGWQTALDVLGRDAFSIDPLGQRTRNYYDYASELKASLDPLGHKTLFTLDALGRTTEVTDPNSGVTSTVYDAVGNVSATVDALGRRMTYTFDSFNRQTAVTNPLGNILTTVYDANGNATVYIDQLGKRTTYTFDELNRPVTRKAPDGGVFTWVYDAAGNVTTEINELGNRTTYTFDALNQNTKIADARGGVVTLGYDANGNRTSIVDPVGNRTTFTFDELNRQKTEIDPLGKVFTTSYNAAGQVTMTVDRDNRKREYTYDDAGRETKEVWKDQGGSTVNTLTWTYDARGNVLTAQDSHGTYTLGYDSLDRVNSAVGLFGVRYTFSYDAVGNRTKVEDSFGGVLTSVYDNGNRLTQRDFGGVSQTPLRFDLDYSVRDQVTTMTRYSDLAGTTKVGDTLSTYDDNMRLTNLKHRNGSATTLENYTYSYDVHSRAEKEVLNGTTVTWTYDATDQISTEVTGSGTTTYTFDLNGNRTMAGYTIGSGNRVTNDGTWTYTYDDEGNMTQKSKGASAETWTFAYDTRNQMTGTSKRATSGGTLQYTATYAYDVFNNRVQSDEWTTGGSATTVKTTYADTGVAFADLDSGNSLTTRYLYQNDVQYPTLVARIDSGSAYWYFTDRLGSTRHVVDGSGTLVGTLAYDAFGNITSESDSTKTGNYTVAGYRFDRTPLELHPLERIYVPSIGGWGSEDRIRTKGGDWNLRRYVHNNPMNVVDPSGLEEKEPEHILPVRDLDGSTPRNSLILGRNRGEGPSLTILKPPDDGPRTPTTAELWKQLDYPRGLSFEDWKATWSSDSEPTLPSLDSDTIDAWKGKWKELDVQVFDTDYFPRKVPSIMRAVSTFYARYGVFLKWTYHYLPTPKTWVSNAELGPGGGNWDRHRYQRYFDELDIYTNLSGGHAIPSLSEEPEVKWYWDKFAHVPSVFFIGSIDAPGIAIGPDVAGLSYNRTFAWVPDLSFWPWLPDEDVSTAHEIGHILGLDHDPVGLSLMRGDIANVNLAKSKLNDNEVSDCPIRVVLISYWDEKQQVSQRRDRRTVAADRAADSRLSRWPAAQDRPA